MRTSPNVTHVQLYYSDVVGPKMRLLQDRYYYSRNKLDKAEIAERILGHHVATLAHALDGEYSGSISASYSTKKRAVAYSFATDRTYELYFGDDLAELLHVVCTSEQLPPYHLTWRSQTVVGYNVYDNSNNNWLSASIFQKFSGKRCKFDGEALTMRYVLIRASQEPARFVGDSAFNSLLRQQSCELMNADSYESDGYLLLGVHLYAPWGWFYKAFKPERNPGILSELMSYVGIDNEFWTLDQEPVALMRLHLDAA